MARADDFLSSHAMNVLRQPIFAFALSALLLTIPNVPAFAQSTVEQGLNEAARTAGFDVGVQNPIAITVGRIVNVVLAASGMVFLILLIYGGILYMIAGGQEDTVKKAKRLLSSSVIGLIIITSAYAASLFILDQLAEVLKSSAQ